MLRYQCALNGLGMALDVREMLVNIMGRHDKPADMGFRQICL